MAPRPGRDDREVGGDQHVSARLLVGGVGDRALEVLPDHPDRVQRVGVAVRVPLRRGDRLDRVGERVHPGRRGDRRRQRGGGLGVEDREVGGEREVEDQELDVALGVLDDRDRARLGARARGRRDRRQRRQRQGLPSLTVLARKRVDPLPAGDLAAVDEEDVRGLRGVDHRPTSDREEGIGAGLVRGVGAGDDHARCPSPGGPRRRSPRPRARRPRARRPRGRRGPCPAAPRR